MNNIKECDHEFITKYGVSECQICGVEEDVYFDALRKSSLSPQDFIQFLIETFAEKLSDVVDMCEHYLETGKKPDFPTECRFIYAKVPETDIEIEFDTLTTHLSYHRPLGQWEECVGHDYKDE